MKHSRLACIGKYIQVQDSGKEDKRTSHFKLPSAIAKRAIDSQTDIKLSSCKKDVVQQQHVQVLKQQDRCCSTPTCSIDNTSKNTFLANQ